MEPEWEIEKDVAAAKSQPGTEEELGLGVGRVVEEKSHSLLLSFLS